VKTVLRSELLAQLLLTLLAALMARGLGVIPQ
jgi:putative membrane protein